ncbi:MAG: hypothetical protein AAF921_12440 [Cyanobacteria bacterium P01_D01_bin.44]
MKPVLSNAELSDPGLSDPELSDPEAPDLWSKIGSSFAAADPSAKDWAVSASFESSQSENLIFSI